MRTTFVVLAGALAVSAASSGMAATSPAPVGQVVLPPLSYTVDAAGPANGTHPRRQDSIVVRYTLTLLDGTVVDSSAERGEPTTFPLGKLIPAWQVLLQLMRPGDRWTFYVPPEYGYGAVAKEKLPANSFLIFKVELVAVSPTPAP